MGASPSREQVSSEQREAESLAASTGSLNLLKKAFSNLLLNHPQTQSIPITSLQECFQVSIDYQNCEPPQNFPGLLNHLSSSILDHFFLSQKDALNWISFLNGYTKCCGRMPTSNSLNNLLSVFGTALMKSGATTGLQIDSSHADYKISGYLLPANLLMLLWMCYVMSWNSRNLNLSKGKQVIDLPDINNLVLSAISLCGKAGAELNIRDDKLLGSNIQLPIGKLHVWILKTVPNLPDCLVQFIHSRLSNSASQKDKPEASSSSTSVSDSIAKSGSYLLTHGRAWAISLTLRSTMCNEILKTCFASDVDELKGNILYRFVFLFILFIKLTTHLLPSSFLLELDCVLFDYLS